MRKFWTIPTDEVEKKAFLIVTHATLICKALNNALDMFSPKIMSLYMYDCNKSYGAGSLVKLCYVGDLF